MHITIIVLVMCVCMEESHRSFNTGCCFITQVDALSRAFLTVNYGNG